MTRSIYEPDHRARRALLGLVAVALFASTVWLTWFFLRGGLRDGYAMQAVFSAPGVGQQLPANGDVKVRGVLVGSITRTRLDGEGNAVIEFLLNRDVSLPVESRAEIRSKTVFGQKWLELLPPPGTGAGALLTEGSVIPDDRTTEPLELERAMQLGHDLLSEIPYGDLAVTLEALARGFHGQEDDARRAIDRGLVALEAVNTRRAELDLALRQLGELSAWLEANDETLLDFMGANAGLNEALIASESELRSNLDSVPQFLNDFTDFQELTEADLGRLIERGATLADLLAARSGDLVDLIAQLRPFTTVWNSGLSQPCEGEFETDMTCWQVYLLPGLEARGFYGPGDAPDDDEPGDPNFVRGSGAAPAEKREFLAALAAAAHRDTGDLGRLLFGVLSASGREVAPEPSGGPGP